MTSILSGNAGGFGYTIGGWGGNGSMWGDVPFETGGLSDYGSPGGFGDPISDFIGQFPNQFEQNYYDLLQQDALGLTGTPQGENLTGDPIGDVFDQYGPGVIEENPTDGGWVTSPGGPWQDGGIIGWPWGGGGGGSQGSGGGAPWWIPPWFPGGGGNGGGGGGQAPAPGGTPGDDQQEQQPPVTGGVVPPAPGTGGDGSSAPPAGDPGTVGDPIGNDGGASGDGNMPIDFTLGDIFDGVSSIFDDGIGGVVEGIGSALGNLNLSDALELAIQITDQPQPEETSKAPWREQQPYLLRGFEEAGRLYDEGPWSYFPGQNYVGMDPLTQEGRTEMAERARQGSDVVRAAQGGVEDIARTGGVGPLGTAREVDYMGLDPVSRAQLEATAQGEFLGSNPYLDDQFDAAASRVTERFQDEVLPGINASFSAAGRGGSGLNQVAAAELAGETADALAMLGADIYGGAYETERGRMTDAASNLGQLGTTVGSQYLQAGRSNQARDLDMTRLGLDRDRIASGNVLSAGQIAPNLGYADYADSEALIRAGELGEAADARRLAGDMERFNFQQRADDEALNRYLDRVSGGYGSFTTVGRDQNPARIPGLIGTGYRTMGIPGAILGGIGGILT